MPMSLSLLILFVNVRMPPPDDAASSARPPGLLNGQRNGFLNPQIGPGVRQIPEMMERDIRKKFDQFIIHGKTEMTFPPMPSEQRQRVHELARERGFNCRSRGSEPHRFCVISRKVGKVGNCFQTAKDVQAIALTDSQIKLIDDFILTEPITDEDITRHLTMNKEHHRGTQRDNPFEVKPQVPCEPRLNDEVGSFRANLPVYFQRDEILSAIGRNEVTFITGGTGCGKTTQVPQYLLEQFHQDKRPIRIICTQPRRLPAMSVAERVAFERGEHVAETVGYHIRLEQRTSEKTVLTYCTSGVLLRMLSFAQNDFNATHIILDEVHEREKNTDYLLIAIREALKLRRGSLKVILMSATMEGNIDTFMNYFREHSIQHIDIPSRLFEVKQYHLGEVLALSGYSPPTNEFFGGIGGISTWNRSTSYPAVESFNAQSHSMINALPQNGYNSRRGMHCVQTAPNLEGMSGQSFGNNMNAIAAQLAAASMHQSSNGQQQSAHFSQPPVQPHQNQYVHPSQLQLSDEHQRSFSEQHSASFSVSEWHPRGQETASAPPGPWTHTQSFSEVQLALNADQQRAVHHWQQQSSVQFNGAPSQQQPSFYLGNAGQYYPSYAGQMFCDDGGAYGAQMERDKCEQHQQRQRLANVLPRHDMFSLNAVCDLETARKKSLYNDQELVDIYMNCGGNNYIDSVDTDLVMHVIKFLMDSSIDGAILVFLPGFDDINILSKRVLEEINASGQFKRQAFVCPLHSQLQSSEQQRVFEHTDMRTRKVILSTNIAEASLTIDDVVFVIDCGKVKEKSFEPDSRISQLRVQWIAKSNAEQRSGRAGRCQPGYCFRLYSKRDYEELHQTQIAEMRRVAIHEVCLHAKRFAPPDISVREFIQKAPEPPSESAVESSLLFLEQLGALYRPSNEAVHEDASPYHRYREPPAMFSEGALTPLGRILAILPLEPQLARLLLFGVALKCLSPVMNLVAALSYRDPFVLTVGDERELTNKAKDEFALLDLSDHLMLIRVMNEYDAVLNNGKLAWCRARYLSTNSMRMIQGTRRQLAMELRRAGIIQGNSDHEDPELNWNSDCWPMIRAAIIAGCYPEVGYVCNGNKLKKVHTANDGVACVHASSMVRRQLLKINNNGSNDVHLEFVVFQEISRVDSQLSLRTLTVVPPLAMVLFSGLLRLKKETFDYFEICKTAANCSSNDDHDKHCYDVQPMLEIDSWFAVRGPQDDLRRIVQLRFRLMNYFLNVTAQPKLLYTKKYDNLLETLRAALELDHNLHFMNPVSDLRAYLKPDRSKVPSELPASRSESSVHTARSHPSSSLSDLKSQSSGSQHQQTSKPHVLMLPAAIQKLFQSQSQLNSSQANPHPPSAESVPLPPETMMHRTRTEQLEASDPGTSRANNSSRGTNYVRPSVSFRREEPSGSTQRGFKANRGSRGGYTSKYNDQQHYYHHQSSRTGFDSSNWRQHHQPQSYSHQIEDGDQYNDDYGMPSCRHRQDEDSYHSRQRRGSSRRDDAYHSRRQNFEEEQFDDRSSRKFGGREQRYNRFDGQGPSFSKSYGARSSDRVEDHSYHHRPYRSHYRGHSHGEGGYSEYYEETPPQDPAPDTWRRDYGYENCSPGSSKPNHATARQSNSNTSKEFELPRTPEPRDDEFFEDDYQQDEVGEQRERDYEQRPQRGYFKRGSRPYRGNGYRRPQRRGRGYMSGNR